jgi:hypothetical protein
LLAEALFERIDVLGASRVHLHPSASAQAQALVAYVSGR